MIPPTYAACPSCRCDVHEGFRARSICRGKTDHQTYHSPENNLFQKRRPREVLGEVLGAWRPLARIAIGVMRGLRGRLSRVAIGEAGTKPGNPPECSHQQFVDAQSALPAFGPFVQYHPQRAALM